MANNLPMDFGNYILLDLVARGGMAEVYRAKMRTGIDGFEKLVAIKKILPHLAENDEFITMLIDEARISVSLNHANIAQVYDLGRVDDSYYLAMEYVSGVDLAHIIKKLGKDGYLLPLDHAIFATKELCAGLYFAHRKTDDNGALLGIVHRDISPHNLLVSFSGDVKIIDFGVAKASVKLGQTRMGVIKGKLLYMAPEQAMARPIDARADIFSAGLCLYRMLTGHLPFEADNEFQIYNNVLTAPIKPPKELNPEIPDDLNNVVMKSLARDLNERYADGWLMHQDLERVLQRVSPGYTSQRLARFMDEYFADERPKAITSSEISAPSNAQARSTSYPSTPSAPSTSSSPSGLNVSAPDTPSNWKQPVSVSVGAASAGDAMQGDTGGFITSGPTVPISSAEIAYMLAHDPSPSMPPLPSPEELGYRPSSAPVIGEEYDGDPTIDMKLDPDVLQKMSNMVRSQETGPVRPPLPVKAATRPKAREAEARKAEARSNSVKVSILLLVLAVVLIIGALIVGFFLFGGMDLLGLDDQAASAPEAADQPGDQPAAADKPPKAAVEADGPPEAVVDPRPAFEAAEAGIKAGFLAARKENPLVAVRIVTRPEGAEVSQGRTVLGASPYTLYLPRSDRPIKLSFKMEGYKRESVEFIPKDDGKMVVVLETRVGSEGAKDNAGDSAGDEKKKNEDGLLDPW